MHVVVVVVKHAQRPGILFNKPCVPRRPSQGIDQSFFSAHHRAPAELRRVLDPQRRNEERGAVDLLCVCVCVLAQQTRAWQKTVCWFLLAIGARVLRQRATNTRARPHAAYDVPCARVRIGYGAPRPPEIADRAWGPPRARRRRGTPPCRSGRPPAPPGPSAAIQAPSAAPDWHRIHKPSPPRVPHR